jgi:hypothetical protein
MAAESRLGYRLPASYIELLKEKNGGQPLRASFRTTLAPAWAPDHLEIETFHGVGGENGIDRISEYLIQEWGYPNIGIVLCGLPSGGHDVIMLDYSVCGPTGEPSVAYIDDERVVHKLANTFKEFADALVVIPHTS